MAIDDIYCGCDVSLQNPGISPSQTDHLNGVPIILTSSLGNIKYTLDNSDPSTSSTAQTYTTPFNILKSNSNIYQVVTPKAVTYLTNKYSGITVKSYNITNGYGNSRIDFNEECDDGNLINNDGCSAVGSLEAGFNCCQDINGKDTCHSTQSSLPYHFSASFNNQVVDPKNLVVIPMVGVIVVDIIVTVFWERIVIKLGMATVGIILSRILRVVVVNRLSAIKILFPNLLKILTILLDQANLVIREVTLFIEIKAPI